MTIDLKTVKHISKLSRISIDDNKAKKLGKDLNSILNYEKVVMQIEKLVNLKHHELLEDLAENIFNMIFKNKLVKKINLKIEKLDILKKTKSVGIEVSKSKVWLVV